MDKLLKDIKEIEFSKIQYNKESEDYYEYSEGKIPILISAPHGARHLRDGSWKEEDEYTAGIAIKLAEMTAAHVIYVKNATKEDSNHDIETKYKDRIREIVKEHGIKFIADIHGANSNRPFKVSIGIINNNNENCSCPSFKDIIQDSLKTFQKNPFNLCHFSASKPGTITSFARKALDIEAAQFEINAKYRIIERKPDSSQADKDYKAEEKKVIELFLTLESMLKNIQKSLMLFD